MTNDLMLPGGRWYLRVPYDTFGRRLPELVHTRMPDLYLERKDSAGLVLESIRIPHEVMKIVEIETRSRGRLGIESEVKVILLVDGITFQGGEVMDTTSRVVGQNELEAGVSDG